MFETSQVLHGLAHGILGSLAILVCVLLVVTMDFPLGRLFESPKKSLLHLLVWWFFVVRSQKVWKDVIFKKEIHEAKTVANPNIEAMNCHGGHVPNCIVHSYRTFWVPKLLLNFGRFIWGVFWLSQRPGTHSAYILYLNHLNFTLLEVGPSPIFEEQNWQFLVSFSRFTPNKSSF